MACEPDWIGSQGDEGCKFRCPWPVKAWPAETNPVNIAPTDGSLTGTQEVSGAVWNPVQGRLYVVDDNSGGITSMDSDGGNAARRRYGDADAVFRRRPVSQ